MLAVSMCIFLFSTSDVYAQDQVPVLQTQDLVIIFGLFCISIIILVLYISRDVILRRKSRYDASKMGIATLILILYVYGMVEMRNGV